MENKDITKKFRLGKIGEHLVCADLLMKGFSVSMASEALPYDILLDIDGRILKIQVKTTETHKRTNQWRGKNDAYVFSVKRKGSNGEKRYEIDEVDIFAIVALDTKQIGYIANKDMPTTINIRVDKFRGLYHDEQGEITFNNVKKMQIQGKKVSAIAKELNISDSLVRLYIKDGFVPHRTRSLYMSDLQKNNDWFYKTAMENMPCLKEKNI